MCTFPSAPQVWVLRLRIPGWIRPPGRSVRLGIEKELIQTLNEPQPVETIFIGGGTPTRLDAALLSRLLTIVRSWFPLAAGGEWTVEANPGTLDAEKVEVLAQGGVNRVSLGAQSFQPRLLENSSGTMLRTTSSGRSNSCSAMPRWSLDLIFGIPASTLADCHRDLDMALSLRPAHLSCYGLVYEKGTNLWKERQAGAVFPVEEELERMMYEAVMDRLEDAGLAMYELSNYARPGHESRHNLVYWANDAYHGVGLGAAVRAGGAVRQYARLGGVSAAD